MTTNVRKLLDEIQQSRLSVENDQRNCHNAIQQLQAVKKNVQTATKRLNAICNEQKEVEEYHAAQSAELSYVKIQERVVDHSLANVQKELAKARNDLRNARKKELEASRKYLQEAVEFGGMWNCSEIGDKNRHDAMLKQRDDTKHLKHRLEFELREFLTKLNHLKEAERERDELEKQYLDQEDLAKSKEDEAYQILRETEEALEQLQKQQVKVSKQCEDEEKRLQRKLTQCQESILFWERRVSETQKSLEEQVNHNQTQKILEEQVNHNQTQSRFTNPNSYNSGTSRQHNYSSNPSVCAAVAYKSTGNANTNFGRTYPNNPGPNSIVNDSTSSCKYPRITPPLRSNVFPQSAGNSAAPKSASRTFQMPVKQNTSSIANSSLMTRTFPNAKKSFPNVSSTCTTPNTSSNSNTSISRFFPPVSAATSHSNYQNQPQSNFNASDAHPRSNPASNRVFQFKKKSPINSSVNSFSNDTTTANNRNTSPVISGPTNRSVPVTLGTTPFSTFQTGRQVHNPHSHNNVPFNHR